MWKVTNKNAIFNENKNIAIDNIFFFQTREEAEDYINTCQEFHKRNNGNQEQILERCNTEEDRKYNFDQYDQDYNPNNLKMPNVMIERPIAVPEDTPYWITRRELCIARKGQGYNQSRE